MLASARAAGGPVWVETLLWIRLPLQPLLIWMVYRYAASPLDTPGPFTGHLWTPTALVTGLWVAAFGVTVAASRTGPTTTG